VQPPRPSHPPGRCLPCVTVTQTYAVKLDPHCPWRNPTPNTFWEQPISEGSDA